MNQASSHELFLVEVDDQAFEILENGESVVVDGKPVDVSIQHIGGTTYSLLIDGRSYEFTAVSEGDAVSISGISRKTVQVSVLDRIARLLREASSSERRALDLEIRAPMPGLVLKIEVAKGDEVHVGTGLVVLEAMKMENEIFATGQAVVDQLHVRVGEPVTKGQLLITLA